LAHTDKVEDISKEGTLYLPIQWRLCLHARTEVDLNQPSLQVFIYEDIKSVDLEAIGGMHTDIPCLGADGRLDRKQCLNDKVVDPGPHELNVHAHTLQVFEKS
jgi:hypothetical protein